MDVGFKTRAKHPDRIADALLIIDDEFLRKDVNDLAVGRKRNGPRRLDDATHVFTVDLARACGNRGHATAVEASDVWSGETDVHHLDFAARHRFGFTNALFNRFGGCFNTDDSAALQSPGFCKAETDRLKTAFPIGATGVLVHGGDQGAHFGRADIETYNVFFSASHGMLSPLLSSFIRMTI